MGQVLGNDTQRVKEGPLRIHKRETVLRLIGIVLQRIPLEAYATHMAFLPYFSMAAASTVKRLTAHGSARTLSPLDEAANRG
jgi:hypothetical protein